MNTAILIIGIIAFAIMVLIFVKYFRLRKALRKRIDLIQSMTDRLKELRESLPYRPHLKENNGPRHSASLNINIFDIFDPRPSFGEVPMPEPPAELSAIHFSQLSL